MSGPPSRDQQKVELIGGLNYYPRHNKASCSVCSFRKQNHATFLNIHVQEHLRVRHARPQEQQGQPHGRARGLRLRPPPQLAPHGDRWAGLGSLLVTISANDAAIPILLLSNLGDTFRH